RWAGAELSSIAKEELAPYLREGSPRVRIDGPVLMLEPMKAQAIAIALHELATNAAKYGALSDGKAMSKSHGHARRTDSSLAFVGQRETAHPSRHPRAKASAHTSSDASLKSNQRAKCASIGVRLASDARSLSRSAA